MKYQKEFYIDDDIAVQVAEDQEGRVFYNIKYKKKQDGVFCKDKKNQVLKGYPRIIYRVGNSRFGEEIYFQFWITEEGENYTANTQWENMEWYFSTTSGIRFLEVAVDYIKKIREKNGL